MIGCHYEASSPHSDSTVPGSMALYEPLAHCRARGHQSQSELLTVNAAGRNGLDSCNIANASVIGQKRP